MWFWIVLAVLAVILLLPVAIHGEYSANGTKILLKIGPVPVRLYPRKQKNSSGPDERKEKKKKSSADKKQTQTGGKWTDFLPLLQTAWEFLKDLNHRLVVKDLFVNITLAGGDPCDLGTNYGRAWAGVGTVQPYLSRIFNIKKQKINVNCDYTADETRIFGRLHISIILFRLLALAVRYGIRILKQYFKIQNNRKGGTDHEPKSSSDA